MIWKPRDPSSSFLETERVVWSDTLSISVEKPALSALQRNLLGAGGTLVGGAFTLAPLWNWLFGLWRKRGLTKEEREKLAREERLSRVESLHRQRQQLIENLNFLEEQKARYGMDFPLSLKNQIDLCQQDLARVDKELAQLEKKEART